MQKVKVGDKMKCVKTVFSFDDPELVLCKAGEIVTAIEVDEDNGPMVETENKAHSFFAEEGEFEVFVAKANIEVDLKKKYAKVGAWIVQVHDQRPNYAYFENTFTGVEGGLWFNGKTLIDYDGVFTLPRRVGIALQALGYDLGDCAEPE